jgi:hypothetical protein
MVRTTTAQNFAQSTKITWNVIDFDVHSDFNNSSDRFVVPVRGLYFFHFSTALDTNEVRVQEFGFRKNGGDTGITTAISLNNWHSSNEHPGVSMSGSLPLAKDDYIEVFMLGHSDFNTSNLNGIRGSTASFGGWLVAPHHTGN